MMELGWESSLLCLNAQDLDAAQVADAVYARVCRTDFDAPGCCLINLGSRVTSQDGRQFMVHLTASLSEVHHARAGDSLSVLSAARFDQQVTTKPHLDGGPEQCLLVLGYEPTEVSAELRIFDYAKCAIELGQTPAEFLEHHNPMFQPGYERLQPYGVRIPCFSQRDFQVACINNSCAPFDALRPRWQGVLHSATIPTPDSARRRVVNSILLASAEFSHGHEVLSDEELRKFMQTRRVKRRGHDKPDLEE